MITPLGDNLHVLLLATTSEDWQSFGTWYSISKNLPYADFTMIYLRQKGVTPFQMFQWAKRLELNMFGLNDQNDLFANRLVALRALKQQQLKVENVLIIDASVMIVDTLSDKLCQLFNNSKFIVDLPVMFTSMNMESVNGVYNNYILNKIITADVDDKLCNEAKETVDVSSLVTYSQGCGAYIQSMVGCPFANSNGLTKEDMTINEARILELWRKMTILFNAVC